MENTYVIAWKSKSEPRWGQGKKLFTRDDAETLAQELNEDYPSFFHEALNLAAATAPAIEAAEPSIINVDFTAPAPELVEAQAMAVAGV